MTPRPRLGSIALPTEHGGWGFTLEPALLGLLVAPSSAGWWIAAATVAAFLSYRPARLALGDLARRRTSARTGPAAGVAVVYASVALGALIAAFAVAEHGFWHPLAAAVPLFGLQLLYDARRRTRALVREMAGPIALGSVASAVAAAGGAGWPEALGLWIVIAARVTASVPLVRAQIRRFRSTQASAVPVVVGGGVALGAAAVGAAGGWVPWSALIGLGSFPMAGAVAFATRPVRATVVGLTQLVLGLVVVVATAAGHWI